MNLVILQNKLKEALNIIGRATSKSSSLPILKNILIKTDDNFLQISATDLEMGIKLWTLVKVNKKGSTTIPFSSFSSFINLLPDKKIELLEEDNNLSVECEDYNIKINGINEEEFPIIPSIKEENKIILKSNILCEGLTQIIDIPSLSKVKPEISGILFLFNNNELKLVATDSYRLAERKISLKEKSNDFSFIIPQRTAKEIFNIFKDIEKDVEIIFGENQILFKIKMEEFDHSYIEITSKIIEGNYPDYKNIIPSEFKTKVILNREEFLNKIKAASVFTSKINEINVNILSENKEIIIKSSNSSLGNYEAKLGVEVEGEDVNMSFNYKFLLDGLSNIKSSEIIFEVTDENSPGVLKPVGKDNFLYVVMPIKN